MNHNVLSTTSSIPLHCNICPKKPDFSDVSHLLTHVASKGHLSNYYKMKVKASTDPASKNIVDEYDDWYEEWNVQDLMMERMSQKEKKKGSANTVPNSHRGSAANSVTSETSRHASVATGYAGRRSQAHRESTLDPQLGLKVKVEPNSRSVTPVAPWPLDQAALNRSYAPPMQSWPTMLYDLSPIDEERSGMGSLYSTPSRESTDFDLPRRANRRGNLGSLNGSNGSFRLDDEAEPDDGLNGNTRLKGVYWEGMGMFDSATPEMRRKRNQKKQTSVIDQLIATSEVVEPEELVFDSEGDLRRTRPITGNPEEDDGMSPLKGESTPEPDFPPKKKPGRRPRPALTEKDVNTNRVSRRQGESHHPPFTNRRRRDPYYDDQDEEDELTYGRSRPRSRNGLRIHRDNSGPDITFHHPAPLTTLTSGFCSPFQAPSQPHHAQATYEDGFVHRGHGRQPSCLFGTSFRPASNNPLNVPPVNIGSFGQLNGQSMMQNQNFHSNNPFALANGQQAFTAFQQQFGGGQQPFNNDGSVFQNSNNTPWDMFGFGQQDSTMQNNLDGGFYGNGDFGSVNPLFFSSNHAVPEDDEATVSPPSTEH